MKLMYKIGVVVLLVGIVSIQLFMLFSKPKIAFVDTSKVYNEFKLKIELETEFKKIETARKIVLDSLMIDIKALSKEIELSNGKDKEKVMRFSSQKERFILKQKQFEEDNQALAKKYTDQTWNQLNQYISDYGEEKGYVYILGANGDGNLLYAQKTNNVSDELITYINNRYNGQ